MAKTDKAPLSRLDLEGHRRNGMKPSLALPGRRKVLRERASRRGRLPWSIRWYDCETGRQSGYEALKLK